MPDSGRYPPHEGPRNRIPGPRDGTKQMSLFLKKDVARLLPHQASPAQFAKLSGIQWHGNYDESSVTKADGEFDLHSEFSYGRPGGVHAGTKRAAKDRLDEHGAYSNRHANPFGVRDENDRLVDSDVAHEDAVRARGGVHGYIHPVLPHSPDIVPGRRRDAGGDWGKALGDVNGRLRRDLRDPSETEPVAWAETNDPRLKGLRYRNAVEHPLSLSTLIPNRSPMQHSDYVEQALRNASGGVHPLTHHLFKLGVLDKVEAQRYLPTALVAPRGSVDHISDVRKDRRSERPRSWRPDVETPTRGQMELF